MLGESTISSLRYHEHIAFVRYCYESFITQQLERLEFCAWSITASDAQPRQNLKVGNASTEPLDFVEAFNWQLEIVDNEQCVGLESLSIGRLGHRQHGISPSVMDCPNRKPSTWLHIFMQFGVLYNYISTLLTEPTVAPSYKSRTKWNSEMTLTHLLPCQWDITRFGLH